MQPWRALILIQVAPLRSATTSTRPKKTKLHTTKKAGFGLFFLVALRFTDDLNGRGGILIFQLKYMLLQAAGQQNALF